MSLHVKNNRELARWQGLADANDLPTERPKRAKRPKRPRTLYRSDQVRALSKATTPLERTVKERALARMDAEQKT